MSFLRELKERLDGRRQAAQQYRLAQAHEDDRANWEADLAQARADLALASAQPEDFIETAGDVPMLLKKGEFPILVFSNAGLIEVGRERGSYQGGSQGVSFRVAKGVSYRVGGHRGTFTPGPEVLKIVDTGTAVVTNQRVVFQGEGKTREWLFTKLIGVDHDPGRGLSMLHVSNRQKASGLAYGEDVADTFRLRMDVALAHHGGDIDALQLMLKERAAELERREPVPPSGLELPPRPDA